MRALIVQYGCALIALAALWHQPEVQWNVVYKKVLEM